MQWLITAAVALIALALISLLLARQRILLRELQLQRDSNRDLSERAAASEKDALHAQRLAEVGTLTGGLAHEIKNPLSTVILNLQLLAEDLSPNEPAFERLRHRLATVQRETTRLRDILDDFLRYAGKLELNRQPVNLNQLLDELVDFFAPQAQLQRVQIRLRLPMEPVIAAIDSKTIKQTLLNLMINAVQAMTGGGELILSLTSTPDSARIDVIDTGPGIASQMQDKVFTAYYSTKRGGTGLGLAMALRIAREHGGTLDVQSELGKGSDFILTLPLSVPAGGSLKEPPSRLD